MQPAPRFPLPPGWQGSSVQNEGRAMEVGEEVLTPTDSDPRYPWTDFLHPTLMGLDGNGALLGSRPAEERVATDLWTRFGWFPRLV